MRKLIWIIVILAAFPMSLAAQAEASGVGFMLDTGYSRPFQANAYGVAGGASVKWKHLISFSALDFSFYPGDHNPRYYTDTFSNGQTRCRDRSNGQFADTSLCGRGTKVITAGMFDGNLLISRLLVGGGYRVGDGRGAYGAAGYAKSIRGGTKSFWFIRGLGGKDIVQVHIGVATY
jgi:hypothetical protein